VGKTYNRRQFLAHSAATAGGVVAAGSLADQFATAGAAGATPIPGGTLNVGVISEQNAPFVPDYATMDTSGFNYARAVYDPLMVVSADGSTVYPYLAQSLTHNAGFDEWTITARKNIKFHNGAPCNGDAIYANLVADYNSALTGAAIKGLISDFTHKKGSSTVTIKTTRKWVTFPYTLAEQQIAFMAEPDTLTGPGGKGAPKKGTNPVGTGPFIFSHWNYNHEFMTVRNANYWRAPGTLPYLNALNFFPVPNSGARLQGLQGGHYDLIIEGDSPTILEMQSLGGGYNVITDLPSVATGYTPVYQPSVGCVMLNLRSAPFNNANMRKGCAYAINRNQFVGVIDDNVSASVDGIYLPSSPYYKHPSYPAYDLATAKHYINLVPKAERSFTMGYVTGDTTILDAAQYVQNALKAAGVHMTLKPVSQGTLILDAIEHNFQALLWAQFGGVSADLNYPWFSTESGALNFAGNFDKKIQSDMQAGMAATTAAARETAWGAVNNKIDADLPYLWLDRAVLAVGATSHVQNWQTFSDPVGNPVLQPNQAVLFFTEVWKS
jgi:peptide/nickel transport system substrate-binding protein